MKDDAIRINNKLDAGPINNRENHRLLLVMLSNLLITAGREYCTQITDAFFRLGHYPKPEKLSFSFCGGSKKGDLDVDGEMAPQLLNVLCQGLQSSEKADKIILQVVLEGQDEKLIVPLYDGKRSADLEACHAWELLHDRKKAEAVSPDYKEQIQQLEALIRMEQPYSVRKQLDSALQSLKRRKNGDTPEVLLEQLPVAIRAKLEFPLCRWRKAQRQLIELMKEHGERFPSREEMLDCLTNYFDLMIAMMQQFDTERSDGLELLCEHGDAIKAFVHSVLLTHSLPQDESPFGLDLAHPLVLFDLYNAYELIEKYTGWDKELREHNWEEFWLGSTPCYRNSEEDNKNRNWDMLKEQGNQKLQNSMNRMEQHDLIFRLLDHVISDRIASNAEHSVYLEGEEYLLRGVTVDSAGTLGGSPLLVGQKCTPLTSRSHIALIRLAEKIMYTLEGVSESPIKIAVVGETYANDVADLWKMITRKDAWFIGKRQFAVSGNPFELHIFIPGTFKNEEVVKLSNISNNMIEIHEYWNGVVSKKGFWEAIRDLKDFRITFLLDCDGVYETVQSSRSGKFRYLHMHADDNTLRFDDTVCGTNIADGWSPENTLFLQAYSFLDSLDYASKAQPDLINWKRVDLENLQKIGNFIQGNQEIFLYASSVPEESLIGFYQSDTLRIAREESFSSDSMTILRIGKKTETPNMVEERYRSDSTLENPKADISFSMWSLFKSFDSLFYCWIPDMIVPYSEEVTIKEIIGNDGLTELLKLMKNTYFHLDYSNFVKEKTIRYWFEFGGYVVESMRKNKAHVCFEAFVKKCLAEIFCWMEGELPNKESALAQKLSQRCIRSLYYSVLGRSKSIQDIFFYYALRNDSWLLRDVKWVYCEDSEKEFEIGEKNHTFDVLHYNDRMLYWQLLKTLDSSSYNKGSERFLYSVSTFMSMHEFGAKVKQLCENLGYESSSLYIRASEL